MIETGAGDESHLCDSKDGSICSVDDCTQLSCNRIGSPLCSNKLCDVHSSDHHSRSKLLMSFIMKLAPSFVLKSTQEVRGFSAVCMPGKKNVLCAC